MGRDYPKNLGKSWAARQFEARGRQPRGGSTLRKSLIISGRFHKAKSGGENVGVRASIKD